jgi:hypothetical protein
MDAEMAAATGELSAVLGVIEFRVKGRKPCATVDVNRQLVVRRRWKITDPFGSCPGDSGSDPTVKDTMIHVSALDIYRDFERVGNSAPVPASSEEPAR